MTSEDCGGAASQRASTHTDLRGDRADAGESVDLRHLRRATRARRGSPNRLVGLGGSPISQGLSQSSFETWDARDRARRGGRALSSFSVPPGTATQRRSPRYCWVLAPAAPGASV